MKDYLMVLGVDVEVLDKNVKALFLKKENDVVLLPVIVNGSNVFVDVNKGVERLLLTNGYSYLSGTIEQRGGGFAFIAAKPFRFVQYFLGNLSQEDLEVDPSYIDMDVEAFDRNREENLLKLCRFLETKLSTAENKMAVVLDKDDRASRYDFEVYHAVKGYAKGVMLVHNTLGLCMIRLRVKFNEKKYYLSIESQHNVLYLDENNKTLSL